jgi:anti-sigma factor ChrR (cupin superfamily)
LSATPRDLTEDQQLDQVLDSAEQTIEESKRARSTWQRNRVNPLPQSRAQLKKARKVKRWQEAGKKREAERSLRLREIREQVINNLSKEQDLQPWT